MLNFGRFLVPIGLISLLAGCSLMSTPENTPDTLKPSPEASRAIGRCGDGICDGPEDPNKCPQDCPTQILNKEIEYMQGPEENSYWLIRESDGRRLFVLVVYPSNWSGEDLNTLVLVPGGSGDSKDFLSPPRFTAATLADAGYLVLVFDPDGRGRSEGNEDYNGSIHQDTLADVIRFAAGLPGAKKDQIGLISFSYGITMASGTLARSPELPVVFLADWEGPADRNDTGGCDEDHRGHLQDVVTCSDEAFWAEHEALTSISEVQVPYQRLQSETDHAQPDNDHAIAMVNAAVLGGVPWVRLNDLPPNQTYDAANPPPMLPDSLDRDLATLLIPYLGELFSSFE